MNIQEYISSGVIEAYVLGIATDNESLELEQLADMYPEIKQHLVATQQAMEQLADHTAVTPPPLLKHHIWHAIKESESTQNSISSPDPATANVSSRQLTFYKVSLAAALLLLATSLAFNMSLWNRTDKSDKVIAELEQQQHVLTASNNNYQAYFSLLHNPQVQTVKLSGVGVHTANNGLVLWNKQTKAVYMSIHNLPAPPQGHQYQLWAIVAGKPVDMGVFDLSSEAIGLQKMKPVANAQMFAVTLEIKGGSPAPTLDQMYLAGKI